MSTQPGETNVTRIKGYLLRLTPDERQLMEHARKVRRKTLAKWMRETLLHKARRDIAKSEKAG